MTAISSVVLTGMSVAAISAASRMTTATGVSTAVGRYGAIKRRLLQAQLGLDHRQCRCAVAASHALQPAIQRLWIALQPGQRRLAAADMLIEYGIHQLVFHVQAKHQIVQ